MKRTLNEIQTRLKAFGFDAGPSDGKMGPATRKALVEFQKANKLTPDGLIGPRTLSKLFPDDTPVVIDLPVGNFDKKSQKNLKELHPLLQKVMIAARKKVPFQILDAQRGRTEQEKAFRKGASKAHFGESAHNYFPAVAADVTPLPLDWEDIDDFISLSKVILATAKEQGVALEWGGGWKSFKDYPHYELPKPWAQYKVKLIGDKK